MMMMMMIIYNWLQKFETTSVFVGILSRPTVFKIDKKQHQISILCDTEDWSSFAIT